MAEGRRTCHAPFRAFPSFPSEPRAAVHGVARCGEAIGGVISPPETTLPDRDLFITHLGLGELLELRVAGLDASLELGVTVRAVRPDPRYEQRPMRALGRDGRVEAPAYAEGDYVVIVEDARVARGEEGFWGGWYVLETRSWPPVPLGAGD